VGKVILKKKKQGKERKKAQDEKCVAKPPFVK